MIFRIIQVTVFSLCLLLTACLQSTPDKSPSLNVPKVDGDDYYTAIDRSGHKPRPGLTPKERFRYALKLLNKDRTSAALVELETYLLRKPNDQRAKGLVKQITTRVSDLYPANSFPVKLKWGQTLSTLARDYLGDVYSYYGLAKYNRIPVSTKLKVGNIIKIPATSHALAVKRKQEAPAVVRTSSKKAKIPVSADDKKPLPEEILVTDTTPKEDPSVIVVDQVAEKDIAEKTEIEREETTENIEEIAKVEEATPTTPVTESESVAQETPANGVLLDAITGDPEELIRKAVAQESYVVAAATLDELQAKQSVSPELAAEAVNIYQHAADTLQTEDPTLAAKYYFQAGQLLREQGNLDTALPALQSSIDLDPDNRSAQKALADTQAGLASKYHRMATKAYRKQQLDEAISLWEYVLEIDPGHDAARAYLAQAYALKAKLTKIRDR